MLVVKYEGHFHDMRDEFCFQIPCEYFFYCFFNNTSAADLHSQNWIYARECQLGKDKLGCDSHMIESPYLNVPVKILPSKLFNVLRARFDRWEE